MSDPITRRDLEAIANKLGRTRRSVRQAVDSGLTRPAEPQGRSRAFEPRWIYPEGTDLAFEAFCQLSNKGYQGGQLRFALWWEGHIEPSPFLNEYICSVFTKASERFLVSLLTEAEKGTGSHYVSQTPTERNEDGITVFDRMAQKAEDVLRGKWLAFLTRYFVALDPQNAFAAPHLLALIQALAAAYLGLRPDPEIGVDSILKEYLGSAGGQNQSTSYVASAWVRELESPGWLDRFLEYLRSRTPDELNQARVIVLDLPFYPTILRWVNLGWRIVSRQISDRYMSRLGVWSDPTLAMNAVLVGYVFELLRMGLKEPPSQDSEA